MAWAFSLALATPAVGADFKFFDSPGEFGLTGQMLPDVSEPSVPIFLEGQFLEPQRVDDPDTPGPDLYNVVAINDRVPGSSEFPQTWADIIANTFLRPAYQKPDPTDPGSDFGTSVVGSASFRDSSGLHYVPMVSRADVSATGAPRIEIVLSAIFGADAEVKSARRFPDPAIGVTEMDLDIEFSATRNIWLDSVQLGNDAFRLVTLSSMFSDSDTYDANALRYEAPNGTVRTLRLSDETPRNCHLLPKPAEIGSWFELVKGPGSDWFPDSPTVRVELLGTSGLSGRLGVQGFLAETRNPNADSLTVWLEWIDAPATIASGTRLSLEFGIVAVPEPRAEPLFGSTLLTLLLLERRRSETRKPRRKRR